MDTIPTAPWVLLGRTWHRTSNGQTLCGRTGDPDSQAWSDDEALADLRHGCHGLCIECEAGATEQAAWEQPLTLAELQSIGLLASTRPPAAVSAKATAATRRKARKVRDRKWAAAEDRDRRGHTPSVSVQALSGGAPTLGKRSR